MSRPGAEVEISARTAPSGAQTDSGTCFALGEAQRGPLEPVEFSDLDSFTRAMGERWKVPHLYDAVEAAFRERGPARVVVRRIVDPAALAASVSGPGFDISATSPGAWGNTLTLSLETATQLSIRVQQERSRSRALRLAPAPAPLVANGRSSRSRRSASTREGEENGGENGGEETETPTPEEPAAPDTFAAVVSEEERVIERSLPTLQTAQDLIDWAAGSSAVVSVSAGDASAALSAGSWTLAGGTDGASVVEDPYALLDAVLGIPRELGPGQLIAPGKVAPAQHEAILAGAQWGNRRAFLDAPPDADVPGLVAHARALRDLDSDTFGGLFAPYAIVPGRAAGTTRTIPWAGIQAGMTARVDRETRNPNQPAAGEYGISQWAVGLARQYSDQEREDLMRAGVNTARLVYGEVRSYGFRTITNPSGPRRAWILLSNSRLAMAIKSLAEEVAEEYVFRLIDGAGFTFGELQGALAARCCAPFWPGALFGDTPEEAFAVDASYGPGQVNTPQSVEALEIHAVIYVRMNPYGELVKIEIVKTPVSEPLPVAQAA